MHIEKFKAHSVCAMILHFTRGREGTLERKNIDRDRTHLNYEIGDRFSYEELLGVIKHVSAVNGRAVRKDAIVMSDIVITAPPNVQDLKKFFNACYESLKIQLVANGLNDDTKMCGYVHLDETSPHMHLAFVPLKKNKAEQDIFSFKTICKRGFYKQFHKDTEDFCERELGYRPSLLIVEDEDLNSLLSRADIDQKAYKELKDRLTAECKAEIKDVEAVLAAKKVKLSQLRAQSKKRKFDWSSVNPAVRRELKRQKNTTQNLESKLRKLNHQLVDCNLELTKLKNESYYAETDLQTAEKKLKALSA